MPTRATPSSLSAGSSPRDAARPRTIYAPPSLARLAPAALLRRLAGSWDLFAALSAHRIRVRYTQSRLGILWAVLQPLVLMAVFTLMVRFLGTGNTSGVPYPVFAYAALVPWTAFSSGLSSAATSITAHASLLTKVAFPRELLPLTYITVALADLLVAAVVLAGLMLWLGVPLTPLALWSVAAVALLALFLVGAGLALAALQVRLRDVGLALPVLLQLWLFATPVLYPLDAVRAALPTPAYVAYLLNPMVGVVDTFRRTLVLQQPPDMPALLTGAAVSLVLLPVAYAWFKWVELTMADLL